jgi:hypothetical protein
MKYWFSNQTKDYLIIIHNETIYSGSIKKYNKKEVINSLNNEEIPGFLFSIPFSYVKSIESPVERNNILIIFGNSSSEEELIVDNLNIKQEIFSYLKEVFPKLEYVKRKPSIFNHAKPQFFAILFSSGLFAWIFYLANQIENGYEYEVVGESNGLSSLILGLAQLGTFKVIIGFILILTIATLSLTKRLKERSITEYLIRI